MVKVVNTKKQHTLIKASWWWVPVVGSCNSGGSQHHHFQAGNSHTREATDVLNVLIVSHSTALYHNFAALLQVDNLTTIQRSTSHSN